MPERFVRASDFADVARRDQQSRMEDGRLSTRRPARSWCRTARSASAGARRANGISRSGTSKSRETKLRLSLADVRDELADVALPLFRQSRARPFPGHRPSRRSHAQGAGQAHRAEGRRGAGGVRLSICSSPITASIAASAATMSARATTTIEPYTPAWAEKITGVPRDQIITVAREFAANAEKTDGRSMVIVGAGDEPLVPHGHELPRHHQHAGDVRLRRPVRRRLVALCRPGEAAAAVRLDAARPSASTGAVRPGR